MLCLCCCVQAFSSCSERWLLSLQSTGSRRTGFSSCGAWAQSLWHTGLVAPRHVGSSRTRARTLVQIPWIGRQILNHFATREALISYFWSLFCGYVRWYHKGMWGEGYTRTLCTAFATVPYIQNYLQILKIIIGGEDGITMGGRRNPMGKVSQMITWQFRRKKSGTVILSSINYTNHNCTFSTQGNNNWIIQKQLTLFKVFIFNSALVVQKS